jgi:hypothetical protein
MIKLWAILQLIQFQEKNISINKVISFFNITNRS